MRRIWIPRHRRVTAVRDMAVGHLTHLRRLLRVGLLVGCGYGWLGCSDTECDQRICRLDCNPVDPVMTCTRGSVTAEVLTRNPQGQVDSYRLNSSLGLFTTCYNTYLNTVHTGYDCYGECHECSCTLVKRHGVMVCK